MDQSAARHAPNGECAGDLMGDVEKKGKRLSKVSLDDQCQPRVKELEQIDFLGTRHGLGAAVHV